MHLFNPENDLALAANTPFFTPPKAARMIRDAGALLPMWWAEESDLVLAPDCRRSEAEELRRKYELKCTVAPRVDGSIPYSAQPWGWSMDARRQFAAAGMDKTSLPSDQQLDRLRDLSHRRISIKLLQALGERPDLIPVEAHTPVEALEAIGRWSGDAYIKLPWSGSGRGVFRTKGMTNEVLTGYLTGFIRRQGSVMVEKTRMKERDFAMLFESTDSGVKFRGVSYFNTDNRGAYGGNLVAPQSEIIGKIGIDSRDLSPLLEKALSEIIGSDYRGWIGVDMMTERRNGSLGIVPCVEVNLRMTMGVAALLIRKRLPEKTPRAILSMKSGGLKFEEQ